jgi:arylsulfatase A-like enzyme
MPFAHQECASSNEHKSMRIQFKLKLVTAVHVALIFIVVGVFWFATTSGQSELAYDDDTSSIALLRTDRFVEQFQLFTTLSPSKKTRLYLSMSERRLDTATAPGVASSTIPKLMEEYVQVIRMAYTNSDKIKATKEKKDVSLEAFRRLARHQPVLRAISRRPPSVPLSVVDKARYENMDIQERLVKRITQLHSEGEVVSTASNTERILACPGCNIIVVSLTTMRKDHMGLYGYEKPTTPHIDAFFKNSLKFTNAFAPSAWTIPDAVSWLTSLFPYTHGIVVRETPSVPLLYNNEVLTLAQILSANGYRTAAFTGGGDYNNRYSGLDRGFSFYLDETNYKDFNIPNTFSLGGWSFFYAPLRSFVGLSTQWLADNSNANFFLFVQGYDTHCPYSPHEPFASKFTAGLKSDLDPSRCYSTYQNTSPNVQQDKTYWQVQTTKQEGQKTESPKETQISEENVRYMTALYDARIAEADYYLDALFQKIRNLGLEKNTIIILMSEHGEMLGENGWFMRGGSSRGTSYEPALNFPILIKHPQIREPIVIDDLIQTVDIMPTLLTMLGLPDPQEVIREGKSLTFSALGDKPTNEYVYAASMFLPVKSNVLFNIPTAAEAIRSKEWKLIKNTIFTEFGFKPNSVSYELYNIEKDPYEKNDLYNSEPERGQDLGQKLDTWLKHFTDPNASS